MDDRDKEIERLKRRIAGLEKTLRIVSGYSGRVEKNLRQLFEVVSDTIPVPMIIASEAGRILFSNGKAREIFGYSEEEFGKTDASDLYENAEVRHNFLKMHDAEDEVKHFETIMKKADGSSFPASLFSRRIIFEGRDCLLTVTYDLSELRHAEEKRLTLERQLRHTRKMEAVGTMAGGIAHDFNNILAIIFGKLQLATMALSDESNALNHIDVALAAADRAKDMIRQILAFCHKEEEERKPFRISTIIAEASKMIQSLTPSNITVNIRINSRLSVVKGDPTQIHQVLMNLSANVNYVLKDRGGIMEIALDETDLSSHDPLAIPGITPGPYVRLSVSDNGPGIEKGIIERVFDPFFTTKGVGEGTGMGLAVVHGIVQNHGGAVHVESEPGEGTAFHCYFPLIADTEVNEEPVREEKTRGEGNERILFVDDEKDISSICKEMLECLGYQVNAQVNSPEALELFRENPDQFDLVLTDYAMPQMSGKVMASEILKIRPDIPVIMLSGGETDDDVLFEIGIKKILRKPFTGEEIGAVIQEVLNKK